MSTQPHNSSNTPPPDPLAVALAKLDPTSHGFDWNALMFAAGRASKSRALLFWRIATGACALAACAFALAYFTQTPTGPERIVYVERPSAKAAPLAAPDLPPGAGPAALEPLPPPPKPAPISEAPTLGEPLEWSFDLPPEQGAAVRWLTTRNEVLTVGLGVLPDNGRKVFAPSGK